MTDFSEVSKNLVDRGYDVKSFSLGAEAADYLNGEIDGKTVGIGGSATVESIGLFEALDSHNDVIWHWKQDADQARKKAMTAEIYISSANALAKTGEIINIDGVGNRVSSLLFGHEKIYFVIGRNKIADDYDSAVSRARNVAAPGRAKQLNRKTPCTQAAGKCYDCRSKDRICNGMVVLWGPMGGMEAEVILIDEDLGL